MWFNRPGPTNKKYFACNLSTHFNSYFCIINVTKYKIARQKQFFPSFSRYYIRVFLNGGILFIMSIIITPSTRQIKNFKVTLFYILVVPSVQVCRLSVVNLSRLKSSYQFQSYEHQLYRIIEQKVSFSFFLKLSLKRYS